MNFRQLKTEEVALLLQGLRTIYVDAHEAARLKLIGGLEAELASRGLALKED